jgi:hypothetical protein
MESGSLAEWVGAIGQVVTACMAAFIAWKANTFTKRSNQLTFYKYLTDLANDWNKIVMSSREATTATEKLRPPVIDNPTDSIIHMYLNYNRFAYMGERDGLVDRKSSKARIKNSIEWFRNVSKEKLISYLSRGYEDEFKNLMLKKYDDMKPTD